MRKILIADAIKKISFITNRRQKYEIICVFILISVSSIVELLGISAVMPFLQALLNTQEFMNNQYVAWIIELLHINNVNIVILLCALLIVFIYILKNIILSASDFFQIKFRCNLHKDLSMKLLKKYMQQSYSFFVETNSSEILRGINGDASSVKGFVNSLFLFVTDGLVTLLIALYLFSVDAALTFGFLVIVLVCLAIIFWGANSNSREMGKTLREADQKLLKNITESIGGIKEFTVMDKRGFLIKQYDNAFERKNSAEKKYSFTVAYIPRMLEAVGVAGLILVVEIRLLMGVDIEEFISHLAVFALAAFKILPSVSRFSQSFTSINYFYPALNAVYSTLKMANIENLQEKVDDLKKENELIFESCIQLKDVYWKYSNSESYVLEKANISMQKNESIAIIGKSGAGKTTVADILLGLLCPEKGSILIDGKDINNDIKEWRRIIGYVPQTVYLYDDTIKNNIAFGINEDEIDSQLLNDVIRKAQLEELIMQLPDKVNTRIGERGVKLSGGQRQRIAIARALYRKPEILVLDEATSALDNETEKAVMNAIEKLHGSITIVIIAHRLSTINSCDRVFEVSAGNIKEISKENIIYE